MGDRDDEDRNGREEVWLPHVLRMRDDPKA